MKAIDSFDHHMRRLRRHLDSLDEVKRMLSRNYLDSLCKVSADQMREDLNELDSVHDHLNGLRDYIKGEWQDPYDPKSKNNK